MAMIVYCYCSEEVGEGIDGWHADDDFNDAFGFMFSEISSSAPFSNGCFMLSVQSDI